MPDPGGGPPGFARLIPQSLRAHEMTSLLLEKFAATGQKHSQTLKPVVSDTKTVAGLTAGFYEMSLDPESGRISPSEGWTAGHDMDEDNAEIPEIQPTGTIHLQLSGQQQEGTVNSKDIDEKHMQFFFHQRSGAFMIKCLSKHSNIVLHEGRRMITLKYQEARMLASPIVMISLGEAVYQFAYTAFNVDAVQRHFGTLLRNCNQGKHCGSEDSFPSFVKCLPTVNAIDHPVIDAVYMEETIGRGSFGWVQKGLDRTTGNGIAIKTIRRDTNYPLEDILEEWNIGRLLAGKIGVVSTLELICEHGRYGEEIRKCPVDAEVVYVTSDLGLCDFFSCNWKSSSLSKSACLSLWKQPLVALREMHKLGIAHRDVQRGNILVMSIDPPRAGMMDFGKATRFKPGELMENFALGPAHTLAPEVARFNEYSEIVDLWSWAIAITEVLGFEIPWSTFDSEDLLDLQDTMLREGQGGLVEFADLIFLLRTILQEDPRDRTTMTEAVEHSCWDEITPYEEAFHDAGNKCDDNDVDDFTRELLTAFEGNDEVDEGIEAQVGQSNESSVGEKKRPKLSDTTSDLLEPSAKKQKTAPTPESLSSNHRVSSSSISEEP